MKKKRDESDYIDDRPATDCNGHMDKNAQYLLLKNTEDGEICVVGYKTREDVLQDLVDEDDWTTESVWFQDKKIPFEIHAVMDDSKVTFSSVPSLDKDVSGITVFVSSSTYVLPDVDDLGKMVREVWLKWLANNPSESGQRPDSWYLSWEEMKEEDKKVDREIGMRLYSVGVNNERQRIYQELLQWSNRTFEVFYNTKELSKEMEISKEIFETAIKKVCKQ